MFDGHSTRGRNGNNGTTALLVFVFYAEICKVVNAHAVSEAYAFVLDTPEVDVVVSAEDALGRA